MAFQVIPDEIIIITSSQVAARILDDLNYFWIQFEHILVFDYLKMLQS